jgi:hypothetical protein
VGGIPHAAQQLPPLPVGRTGHQVRDIKGDRAIKGPTFSDSSLYCWRLRLKSSAPGERAASVDILFMVIMVDTSLGTV